MPRKPRYLREQAIMSGKSWFLGAFMLFLLWTHSKALSEVFLCALCAVLLPPYQVGL